MEATQLKLSYTDEVGCQLERVRCYFPVLASVGQCCLVRIRNRLPVCSSHDRAQSSRPLNWSSFVYSGRSLTNAGFDCALNIYFPKISGRIETQRHLKVPRNQGFVYVSFLFWFSSWMVSHTLVTLSVDAKIRTIIYSITTAKYFSFEWSHFRNFSTHSGVKDH